MFKVKWTNFKDSILRKMHVAIPFVLGPGKILSKKVQTTYFAFLVLLAALLQLSSIYGGQKFLNIKVIHPILFATREFLAQKTDTAKDQLHARLKLFFFDDETASYLKSTDIPLETWGQVLKSLDAKGVSNIIIDKLFDLPYSQEEINQFNSILSTLRAKISIISFTQNRPISYRKQVPASLLISKIQYYSPDDSVRHQIGKLDLSKFVYGSNETILSSVGSFGHAEYEGTGRIKPFIRIQETTQELILPNAAVAALCNVQWTDQGPTCNDSHIPVSDDGRILVNFFHNNDYYKRSFSMLALIQRAKKQMDISVVDKNDVVIILPAMYTGNTDFRETPFGSQAGGFHLVSLANSALTGTWLREYNDPGYGLILICMIAFSIGTRTPLRKLTIIGSSTLIVSLLTGLTLFIYGNVAWSFIFPQLAFLISSMLGHLVYQQSKAQEELRLARELEIATLVQKSFFPKNTQSTREIVAVQGFFQPASECGGDWWGQFHHNSYTYVMIGDAVGHGVPAALVTAVAFSVSRVVENHFHTHPENIPMPSSIMKMVHDILSSMSSDLACMTFQVLALNEVTGEGWIANAGNPQPLHLKVPVLAPDLKESEQSNLVKTVLIRGDVLGSNDDSKMTDHPFKLAYGESLIMYTDGIVENNSRITQKALGKIWFKNLAAEANLQTRDNGDLIKYIWNRYQDLTKGIPPEDDATLVVVTKR
jgi:serine phosphatase RsbU (regulator of sigma subunit)